MIEARNTPRCAVLVALDADDGDHWRSHVAADVVALTAADGPSAVDGLRVTVVFVSPAAPRGEQFCTIRAALRRNLVRMPGASLAIHYLSEEPRP